MQFLMELLSNIEGDPKLPENYTLIEDNILGPNVRVYLGSFDGLNLSGMDFSGSTF